MTYHHFYRVLLGAQNNSITMWDGTTQGRAHQEAGVIGAILEADYHRGICAFLSTTSNHLPDHKDGKLTRDPRKTSPELRICCRKSTSLTSHYMVPLYKSSATTMHVGGVSSVTFYLHTQTPVLAPLPFARPGFYFNILLHTLFFFDLPPLQAQPILQSVLKAYSNP